MKTNRESKLLKIIILYSFLIGLVMVALWASTDIEFNHYQTLGSSIIQAENYFGQFFETGWLVTSIGLIFALIWAGRLQNQPRHAKWFRNAVIVSSILTLFEALISVGLSRIDCADNCVWYILPRGTAYALGIVATFFWFAVSIGIYRFMLHNSLPS